jgi:hypothetical protein
MIPIVANLRAWWKRLGGGVRLALLIAGVLMALGGAAIARPGGGHSFSGGSHSYSGGSHSYSGGGYSGGHSYSSGGYYSGGFADGGVIVLVLIVIAVFFIISLVFGGLRNRDLNDWDSGVPAAATYDPPLDWTEPAPPPRPRLSEVVLDPAFSGIVFEDFAFRLFSTAQRARHSAKDSAALAPYVSAEVRAELSLRPPISQPVQQVVVGALRVIAADSKDADTPQARARITVEYEANVATAEHTYYTVERWIFSRAASVHSKPPGRDRIFLCPNCGAPWQASQSGTQVCASCNQAVDNGRFDWMVEQAILVSSEERPPSLTTETEEQGTDLPTYKDDQLGTRWAELTEADPEVTNDGVTGRLALIYSTLNTAWSSNDPKPVRGMVSDGLFDYLQYWVDAYRQQGLRNVLENMRITQVELAKLVRDPYFDALTLRVFATGLDYTIREPGGQRVVGSKSRERVYSEYWTLIRSAGRKGATHATPTCGNCGAPLQITQSGECEHCGAHVTAGEFDWVLSKIEQDDTYQG